MKIKIFIINLLLFILLYLISDVIFSRFVFKQSVDHKCYENVDVKFYKMRKNCFSNMKMISSIDPFKVYTDNDNIRYSGKKRDIKSNSIIFLGDSQTFGVGSDWEDTFVGILENKFYNFNFYNLGVPSYSPTVYNYVLEQFIKDKKVNIKKIYVLIDITDVADEANRWEIINGFPNLKNQKITLNKISGFSKFKKDNFKGIYLISSKIRSFFRKLNAKKKERENQYKPVEGNPTGAYIYTDHEVLTGCNTENKKSEGWTCGGVQVGLNKVEKNIIKLAKTANKINSEFYIIIMPWPDTLNFGQTKFNWENFNNNLCIKTSCSKLINLFPKFKKIKETKNNWLKKQTNQRLRQFMSNISKSLPLST